MGESKPSWWKKEFDSRYNMLQSLIPHDSSNRQPVQDARFGIPNQGETDIAKLNQPTYNAILQQQYKGNSLSQVNEFGQQRDISGNTSQQVVFGGGVSRTNNSLQNNNFVNLGGNYSYGVSNNAVVQGANGSNLGSNQAHNGINNSLNGRLCPPSTNINAVSGPTGDGFVTVNRNSVSNVHNVVQTPSVYPQINGTNTGYAVNTNAPATGMPGSVTPAKPNVGNTGGVASVLKDMFAVSDSTKKYLNTLRDPDGQLPQKLRNIPPHLIDSICNEIMDTDPNVRWDDIAGLDHAKKCVNEMAVMPLVRPDIFEGCRSPGHGLLLFGPPGTGKTMIGKAIAGEAKATFFYISASSLSGKFFGESEKLVRALFGVASCRQPAVIFVDEIDSLLSKRRGGENDTFRKMKTQFLIEMEGFDGGNDQVLLIEARACIIRNLLEKDRLFKLSEEDMDNLCKLTGGYSGSDMRNLVKEAAMGPVREALKQETDLVTLKKEDMRPVTLQDFVDALKEVKRSVSLTELGTYEDWNSQFGSISTSETSDQPRSGWADMLRGPDGELPKKIRNIPTHLLENICNEIMDHDPNVRLDDIAGLHHAKRCINEMAILPLLRPDLFKGCRSPAKGLLLFGPLGTGKTMIGKAIAGEAKATFFYISASSLTSKWLGESEKLVRALFGVARCRQPAEIFVDEIDSMLSQRKTDGEHECYRRMKTQFFIEMEGFDSGNDQVLLIGATNRPQELDEAARRRLAKRLYIPLPSSEARAWIVRNLLEKDGLFTLSTEDVDSICELTEGYSGSDMKNLVKDASMGPLREALRQSEEIAELKKEDMRSVSLQDFENALQEVRPSVSIDLLGSYEVWNNQFGSLSTSKAAEQIVERNMKKRKTSEPGAYNLSSIDQISNDLDDDDVYEIHGLLDENAGKRSRETNSTEQKSVQVDDTDEVYNEDQMEVFKGILELHKLTRIKLVFEEKRLECKKKDSFSDFNDFYAIFSFCCFVVYFLHIRHQTLMFCLVRLKGKLWKPYA